MKDELDKGRTPHGLSGSMGIYTREAFSMMAMAMKVLAAEDVRVPPGGGLEIIDRKPKDKLKFDGPPIPEIKKF
jgi:hypothetical protein